MTKYNHDFKDRYCDGMTFDQSQMSELEFERLLLWSGRFPQAFTKRHDDLLTAEVYHRAEQVRKARRGVTPEERHKPLGISLVRVSELGSVA